MLFQYMLVILMEFMRSDEVLRGAQDEVQVAIKRTSLSEQPSGQVASRKASSTSEGRLTDFISHHRFMLFV
jgi:hypothetical protein